MSPKFKIVAGVFIVIILSIAIAGFIVVIQQPFLSPSPSLTPTPSPSSPIPTQSSSTPTAPAPTPTPTPPLTEQARIRDQVLNFIRINHPETTIFMTDLAWSGGRVTLYNIVGSEVYIFYAGGWNFTMSYPIIPQPVYSIIADYKSPGVGIPYRVIWEGTWQNQEIKETNYVFAQ